MSSVRYVPGISLCPSGNRSPLPTLGMYGATAKANKQMRTAEIDDNSLSLSMSNSFSDPINGHRSMAVMTVSTLSVAFFGANRPQKRKHRQISEVLSPTPPFFLIFSLDSSVAIECAVKCPLIAVEPSTLIDRPHFCRAHSQRFVELLSKAEPNGFSKV